MCNQGLLTAGCGIRVRHPRYPNAPAGIAQFGYRARVTQTPEPTPAPQPRRRVLSLRGKARYAAGVAVFIAAGALFASSGITARGTNLRSDQVSNLQDLVRDTVADVARTQVRVDRQRQTVQKLGVAAGVPAVEQAQAAIAALQPALSATAISGRGVRVTLDDAPAQARTNPNIDISDLIVHQQDVQAVVNAMWRAHPRGVQVMDQRVSTTTAIKCVGNTLLIQGRVYSPPYSVTAVGDQPSILLSLQNDVDIMVYRDYADAYGLGWQVDRLPNVRLNAFNPPARLQWASITAAAPATATAPARQPRRAHR